MQDWNYWQTSAFEVTVEIGCVKFPDEKYLKQYWEANSESTLRFIELSKIGINGIVYDHQGKPIPDASVSCSITNTCMVTPVSLISRSLLLVEKQKL